MTLALLRRATPFHQPAQDVVGGVAGVLERGLRGPGGLLRLLLLGLLGRVEGVGLVDELVGDYLFALLFVSLLLLADLVPELVGFRLAREVVGGLGGVVDQVLVLGLALVLIVASGRRRLRLGRGGFRVLEGGDRDGGAALDGGSLRGRPGAFAEQPRVDLVARDIVRRGLGLGSRRGGRRDSGLGRGRVGDRNCEGQRTYLDQVPILQTALGRQGLAIDERSVP